MQLQIVALLKRPLLGFPVMVIAFAMAAALFYFDQFLFLSPYVTFYLPIDGFTIFILDLSISVLSGIVLILSAYQLRSNPSIGKPKLGLSGIVAAFIAGACPCYYLVPLLAVAGGAGGILAAIGITFNVYEVPIKLLSLLLLGAVVLSMERTLRAQCRTT